MPIYLKWYIILALSVVLSCIMYPGKPHKDYFITQQHFVSLTMFIEALSLISQLFHMKMSKGVEGLNTLYLTALCISRFSRIYFWYTMSNKMSTFWYLIAADSVHTLMVLAFNVMYIFTRQNVQDGVMPTFGRRVERNEWIETHCFNQKSNAE